MKYRYSKVLLKAAIALCVLLMISILGGSWYMLRYALNPDEQIANKKSTTDFFMTNDYPFYQTWTDSLKREKALCDTFITNKQGIHLHAYYVRASVPTRRTAIIVHGYTDNAMLMMMIGYLYNHDLGFNILLPELQYHGQSEGTAIQMGWKDRMDVLEWMEIANQLYGGDTEMVLHGISMGAATVMMTSGENQPPYVKAYVEDCGYTSVWDQFANELKVGFHLPTFPLLYTTSLLCQIRHGWNFGEASSLKQVARCQLPMFFIHGDKDNYVPTWMVYPLYKAKPEPKELWVVPGAEHAVSYKENRQEYTDRVRKFVEAYIQ